MNRNIKYAAALALALSTTSALAETAIGSWTFNELMSDAAGHPGFAITSAQSPPYQGMDNPYIWISCYAGEYTMHVGGMGRGRTVLLNSQLTAAMHTGHDTIFHGAVGIERVLGDMGTHLSFALVFNFDKEYEVFDAPITPDVLDTLKLAERSIWIMQESIYPSERMQSFPAEKTAAAIDSLSAACTAETE